MVVPMKLASTTERRWRPSLSAMGLGQVHHPRYRAPARELDHRVEVPLLALECVAAKGLFQSGAVGEARRPPPRGALQQGPRPVFRLDEAEPRGLQRPLVEAR